MARAKRKAPPKKRERKSVSRLAYDESHLLNCKKIKTCRNRKKWTEEKREKARQKSGKKASGTRQKGAKKEQKKSKKK